MNQYIVKPNIVADCLARLRSQRIHPNFAGYLCLKHASAVAQKTINLRVNFRDVFETFLRIPDALSKKPYAMPFCDTAPSEANKWFNSNVAGSYAPSSIRPGSPFARVVESKTVDSRKPIYSLVEKHWEAAHTHLAFGRKIPVVALSIFLYRDFAIEVESPTPKTSLTFFVLSSVILLTLVKKLRLNFNICILRIQI